MTRGSPDFVGINSFPLYGPFTEEFQTKTVDAFGFTNVFSLTGKGYILGGWVSSVCGVDLSGDQLGIIIDGNSIQRRTIDTLFTRGIINQPELPLSLLRYSAAGYYVSWLIGGRLTFEESLILEYAPTSADNRAVNSQLLYAKVT